MRLKWGKHTNFRDLNDAEYEPEDREQREPYEGPTPKNGTILAGVIDALWVTEFASGNEGFKVLFVADGNRGERAKYNGCQIWENLPLTPDSKWKWQPFLDMLGVTLRDVHGKTAVDDNESNMGQKVKSIAKVRIPAPAKVVVKREKYEDEWQIRARDWIIPDPPDGDDEEEGDDEDEVPF